MASSIGPGYQFVYMDPRTVTFRRTALLEPLTHPAPAGQWLLLKVIPTGIVLVLVYLAIFGPSGMIRRHRMVVDLESVQRRLSEHQEENALLDREIRQLKTDEQTVRRAITEDLLLVEPDSTIYRFPQ